MGTQNPPIQPFKVNAQIKILVYDRTINPEKLDN